jgi:hypothetical protein
MQKAELKQAPRPCRRRRWIAQVRTEEIGPGNLDTIGHVSHLRPASVPHDRSSTPLGPYLGSRLRRTNSSARTEPESAGSANARRYNSTSITVLKPTCSQNSTGLRESEITLAPQLSCPNRYPSASGRSGPGPSVEEPDQEHPSLTGERTNRFFDSVRWDEHLPDVRRSGVRDLQGKSGERRLCVHPVLTLEPDRTRQVPARSPGCGWDPCAKTTRRISRSCHPPPVGPGRAGASSWCRVSDKTARNRAEPDNFRVASGVGRLNETELTNLSRSDSQSMTFYIKRSEPGGK